MPALAYMHLPVGGMGRPSPSHPTSMRTMHRTVEP